MGAMASTNEEVAALLREYAELLGLTGGDQFRVRGYEKAAKAVAGYPDDLGALPERALIRVPGVGPRRALQIAGQLGITSVAELAEAVRNGRLRHAFPRRSSPSSREGLRSS
jgi:DNA polymerase (family X)